MAEYQLGPWGEERADLRAAIGHALFYNANRSPKDREGPAMPSQFMPFAEPRERRGVELTPEQFAAAMDGFGNVIDKTPARKRRKKRKPRR